MYGLLRVIATALSIVQHPGLQAAEAAYRQGRYEEVLPALEQALRSEMTPRELLRCYELQAMTHAAYDHFQRAIRSFRLALAIDAAFRPSPPLSPKVRRLFDKALRRGPLREVHAEALPAPAHTRPAARVTGRERAPLLRRWWFWTALGVAAVGVAGAITWVALEPRVPRGNLGTGEIQ